MRKNKIVLIAMLLIVSLLLVGCQESDKSKFEKAQSLMAKGQFTEAGAQFTELGSYEESAKLAMYCKAAAAGENEDYETAFSTFSLLGEYKESPFMISYYHARKTESDAKKESNYYYYLDAAKAYDEIALFRDSVDRAGACRQKTYDYALQTAENGDYYTSTELFYALSEYKDSKQLYGYYNAFRLEEAGRYSDASRQFAELGDFKDASEQSQLVFKRCQEASESFEAEGDEHLAKGEWDEAIRAYSAAIAKEYSTEYEESAKGFGGDIIVRATVDSSGTISSLSIDASNETAGLGTRAMEPEYVNHFIGKRMPITFDPAVDTITGATTTAQAVIEAINKIPVVSSEAKPLYEKIPNTYYQKGRALRTEKKWDEAIEAFESAGSFNDAKEQILLTRYSEGEYKRELRDWDGAVKAFVSADGYSDAADQVFATRYAEAEWLLSENKKDEAADVFINIGDYRDSKDRAKQLYISIGDEYLAAQKWDQAIAVYSKIGGGGTAETASAQGFGGDITVSVVFDAKGAIESISIDAPNETAGLGQRAMEKEFTDQFVGKTLPIVYGEGVDALTGSTVTSEAVLAALNSITIKPSNNTAVEKIKEVYYQKGETLLKEAKWGEAAEAFKAAGEYIDAEDKAKEAYVSLGDECLANKDWDNAILAYYAAGGGNGASAMGIFSEVNVSATFGNQGEVISISVDASGETPELGQKCMKETFINQFIGKKPPFKLGENVDAVSGATVTSKAVVSAINSLTPDTTVTTDPIITEKVLNACYLKAKSLDSEGKYEEAYKVFQTIKGYKDVDDILTGDNYSVKEFSVTKENNFSVITVSVKAQNGDIIECTIDSVSSDNGFDLLTDEIRSEWAKAIVMNDTAETDAISGATLKFSAETVIEAMKEILAEMHNEATEAQTKDKTVAPVEEKTEGPVAQEEAPVAEKKPIAEETPKVASAYASYRAEAVNRFSKVTIIASAQNGVLKSVKILSEGEDGLDLLTDAIREEWAKAILESGSAEPDAITSATLTFSAASVTEAMNEILEQMSK